jgi:hypothetical protein
LHVALTALSNNVPFVGSQAKRSNTEHGLVIGIQEVGALWAGGWVDYIVFWKQDMLLSMSGNIN